MGFKTEQPRGELTAVPKGGRRESHSQMIAYTGRQAERKAYDIRHRYSGNFMYFILIP